MFFCNDGEEPYKWTIFVAIVLLLPDVALATNYKYMGICPKEAYNPCPSSWSFVDVPGQRMCVSLVDSYPNVHTAASSTCRQVESSLVEMWNEAFQDKVIELMRTVKENDNLFWIGLRVNDNGKVRWPSIPNRELEYDQREGEQIYRGPTCFAVDVTSGKWVTKSCPTALHYFCMTDKFLTGNGETVPPELEIFYGAPPETVYIGDNVKATCSGFAENLLLLVTIGDKKIEIGRDADMSEANITESYRWSKNGCMRYLNITLTIPTSEEIYLKFQCRVLDKQNNPIFYTNWKFAAVIDRKRNLTLVPEYHGRPGVLHLHRTADFTCLACIRNLTDIFWEVPNRKQPLLFTDPRLWVETTEDPECGIRVKSKLHLLGSFDINKKTVSCISNIYILYRDKPYMNKQTTLPFQVQYGPSTPTSLSVGDQPGTVTLGQTLHANCSGCVGEVGEITWNFVSEYNTELASFQLAALNMTSEVSTTVTYLEDENVTKECFRLVTSRLQLVVTTAVHNTRLVCRTYDGAYTDGYETSLTSHKLQVVGMGDHLPDSSFFMKELLVTILALQLVIAILLCIKRRLDRRRERRNLIGHHRAMVTRRRRGSPRRGSNTLRHKPDPHHPHPNPPHTQHHHPHHHNHHLLFPQPNHQNTAAMKSRHATQLGKHAGNSRKSRFFGKKSAPGTNKKKLPSAKVLARQLGISITEAQNRLDQMVVLEKRAQRIKKRAQKKKALQKKMHEYQQKAGRRRLSSSPVDYFDQFGLTNSEESTIDQETGGRGWLSMSSLFGGGKAGKAGSSKGSTPATSRRVSDKSGTRSRSPSTFFTRNLLRNGSGSISSIDALWQRFQRRLNSSKDLDSDEGVRGGSVDYQDGRGTLQQGLEAYSEYSGEEDEDDEEDEEDEDSDDESSDSV